MDPTRGSLVCVRGFRPNSVELLRLEHQFVLQPAVLLQLLADGRLRVLHGAHHLEEVVVAALERGRGGRRLGDADRGEPPAELVGIGHGGCGMRAGKDGREGRETLPCRRRPCPSRRLGGKGEGRGGEDGGRGCKPAREGGRGGRDWRLETGD